MKLGYNAMYILFMSLFGFGIHQSFAQIPNSGFENWTAGNPDDWSTSNFPPVAINITQTSDAHSGVSAVQGEVIDLSGFAWPPFLISGTNAEGFPVNMQHPALHGWYKYTPVNDDQFFVTIAMIHADTAVGGGGFLMSAMQSTYSEFIVNIQYFSAQVPDTCYIDASIVGATGGLANLGSTYVIDDLAFGPASAVDESDEMIPTSFELFQNYPNPFNPKTVITYSVPRASRVQLRVFNTLGQNVASLVDAQQNAGVYRADFDGTQLPSGTYFYRLQALPLESNLPASPTGGFSQVKKLLLVK